ELAQKSAAAPSAARPAVVDASLPAEGCEDAGPRLLALVADYWNADLPAVATAIQPRCVQYFSALSDKRYTSVEFDGEGRTQVRGGLGSTPASALGPRDADLLFLALKFALIEKSTAFGRVPVVIEDGWGAVDDAKWPLLARMLKHLGTLTQVIQVSSHPAFPPMADGTTTLGA
ncbi:MAG TPA: chromosome segregation protein SMC, partial [Myxococcaceae bacterium]|nr:chromosome segregation protein SMC [Myxococcaceae bacterium]